MLNEIDFGPLMDLHDVMIALKIGRHYKGEFKLTKAGQELVGHPGRIFDTVTPFYLFEVNHARFSRFDDEPVADDSALIVPYAVSKPRSAEMLARAEALQHWLNTFAGVYLKVDGWPGRRTSDAFRRVTGSWLPGDPRG